MKKVVAVFLLTITLALVTPQAKAQSGAGSVFATGLNAPIKIISTPDNKLIVAESGNAANGGRISLLDQSGSRRTLIGGLPSAGTAQGEFSGPTGLEVSGQTLYIVFGEGDNVRPGPAQGTEQPNPTPTSPLFSSVISVSFDKAIGDSAGGFTLTPADHTTLKSGARLRLANAAGETATVIVVADFRDFTYEFNPNYPDNVRHSSPFGAAIKGNTLYLVDSGQNSIIAVDLQTGDRSTIYRFAPRVNPTPVGAPRIDSVPDSIRVFGKRLLVPLLVGFPFPAGVSEIRSINLINNADSPFITGLSSAIDILPSKNAAGQDQFFVLEFSTNFLANAPGRLSRYDSPGGSPVVLSSSLVTPTSIAQTSNGDLFVTQLATGQIIRVAAQ